MPENTRVGLVFLRAEWLRRPTAEGLQAHIEADIRPALAALSAHFEIFGPWVVDSQDTLLAAQSHLRETALDLVVVAYQTWASDMMLVDLLPSIGVRPLVLWCYLPTRRQNRLVSYADVLRSSGPVGALSALGTLRNLAAPFLFIYGAPDDPRLVEDLSVAGRAALARHALHKARFGMLPGSSAQTLCNFVDEASLKLDLGPTVVNIPIAEYRQALEQVTPQAIADYLTALRADYAVQGLTDAALEQAARAALGLASLARTNHLDLVAIQNDSAAIFDLVGMRPNLYPIIAGQARPGAAVAVSVLYQPEADLGAATANAVLHCLTGSPTMLLEFWFWDEARNQMVGGHGGMQNPALASPGQAWVGPDLDYALRQAAFPAPADAVGPQMQLLARYGRVTLFQLRRTPAGWQALAASGICLEGQPWVEGVPHAIVRLDTPIDRFLNQLAETGASQHWVMAYGGVMAEIEAFCQMEKIPLVVLGY